MRPVSQMRCLMAKSWSEVATPDSGRLQTTLNAAQTSPPTKFTRSESVLPAPCAKGGATGGTEIEGGPAPKALTV